MVVAMSKDDAITAIERAEGLCLRRASLVVKHHAMPAAAPREAELTSLAARTPAAEPERNDRRWSITDAEVAVERVQTLSD
jgi:hypothetical protein